MNRKPLYLFTGFCCTLMALAMLAIAGFWALETVERNWPDNLFDEETILFAGFLAGGLAIGYFVLSTFRSYMGQQAPEALDAPEQAQPPSRLSTLQITAAVVAFVVVALLLVVDIALVMEGFTREPYTRVDGVRVEPGLRWEPLVVFIAVLVGNGSILHYFIGTIRQTRKRLKTS